MVDNAAPQSFDFSDLRALYVNCTLKRSPEPSHTQLLMDKSIAIMQNQGIAVDNLRAVDLDLATGVWPDMTEHGWATDEWPRIFEMVLDADILVIGSPICSERSRRCVLTSSSVFMATPAFSTNAVSTLTTVA